MFPRNLIQMLPVSLQPLLHSAAYDDPAGSIHLIQTHISWVIVAGDYVYKIKRPVRFGFLDYSTLAKRRIMCEREVELNRRTCPEAYLGVVPITFDNGTVRVGGVGPVIEHAVKMRRLPADGWLSSRIERAEASTEMLRRVARIVYDFHAAAATGDGIARYGSAAEVAAIWRENLEELRSFAGDTLTPRHLNELTAFGDRFLDANAQLMDERASSGRVRDIHGDLRSDSIYIERDGGICMCDCIEFSDRLRCGDVAGDAAFLAMDLDVHGRRDLADEFSGAYTRLSADDETLPYMLPFYRCYRAAVRGKIESITARDPEVAEDQRLAARERATRYFALATRYANEQARSALVVVGGLSGSGKSHLAAAFAARVGAALVRSDAIRRSALGNPNADPRRTTYSASARASVYQTLRNHARAHLDAGRLVVLDATHLEQRERDATRELAAECAADTLLVWVNADEGVIRSRLTARTSTENDDMSDARWDTYLAQRRSLQPLRDDERVGCIEVDGAETVTNNIARILETWKRSREELS